jgi:hypothetical protein
MVYNYFIKEIFRRESISVGGGGGGGGGVLVFKLLYFVLHVNIVYIYLNVVFFNLAGPLLIPACILRADILVLLK